MSAFVSDCDVIVVDCYSGVVGGYGRGGYVVQVGGADRLVEVMVLSVVGSSCGLPCYMIGSTWL